MRCAHDRREQPPAVRDFNTAQRHEVGNQLVHLLKAKLTQMEVQVQAGSPVAANDMKALAVMFGILTDKRRLEDGQVTDRTEQATVPAREIIEAKILELADRRTKRSRLEHVDTPVD